MPEALPEMSTDYATALLKDFDEEIARLQEKIDGPSQAPRRRGRPKSSPGVKTVKTPSRIQQELACLGPSPELIVGSRSRAPVGKSLRCAVYLCDPGVLVALYEAGAATSEREFVGNQHRTLTEPQTQLHDDRLRDTNRGHGDKSRAARMNRKSRKVLVSHRVLPTHPSSWQAVEVAAEKQNKADAAEAFRAVVKQSCKDSFSWEEVRLEAINVYSLWNVAFEGGARDAAIQHTATSLGVGARSVYAWLQDPRPRRRSPPRPRLTLAPRPRPSTLPLDLVLVVLTSPSPSRVDLDPRPRLMLACL